MTILFRFLPKDKSHAIAAIEEALKDDSFYPHPEKFAEAKTIVDEHVNYIVLAWADIWEEQVKAFQQLVCRSNYVWSSDSTIIYRKEYSL